jgi:hypothetical protein
MKVTTSFAFKFFTAWIHIEKEAFLIVNNTINGATVQNKTIKVGGLT